LKTTVTYAKTREQFKTPIAKFGAIQHKLAEMTIRLFAAETCLFRTSSWIDSKERELEGKDSNPLLGAAEEYAIECRHAESAGF
jgi:alkylation response protein AidB-like acyl-CoA dehydrogenase